MNTVENKMKTFEENLTNNESNHNSKLDLNYICDQKLEGIKIIRSKCNWYEERWNFSLVTSR